MIIFEIVFKLFSQLIKLIIIVWYSYCLLFHLKIVSSQSYNVRWIIIIWREKYSAKNNIELFIWIFEMIFEMIWYHFVIWITRYIFINEIFNELNYWYILM